jgi:putative inorganic carbon (HCO3(-)) transporter
VAFSLLLIYIVLSFVYPGDLFPALAPYRITLWVGVAGLVAAAFEVVAKRRTIVLTPHFWLLGAFTILMAVSRMVADRWLGAPVMVLGRFGPSLTMFVLAAWGVDSIRKLKITTALVVLLSTVLLIQGAAAYHFGYNAKMFLFDANAGTEDSASDDPFQDFEYGVPADNGPGEQESVEAPGEGQPEETNASTPRTPRIRGLGLFHDPNDLAVSFVVAFALLSGLAVATDRVKVALLAVPALILGYGVFLTRSRGGTVAFLVVLWRATANRFGQVPALLLAAALVVGAAAIDFGGGRSLRAPSDEAASGRLTAWTEGLEMLKSSPILGIGYGQFLEHHTLTAHNSLVLCLAETGLLGYFFWVALLVVTVLELRGLQLLPEEGRADSDLKHWAGVLQLSLVAFMTAAFFLSRTFVPTLYLIIGLAAALALIARRAGEPVWLPPLPNIGSLVVACEVGSVLLIYVVVKLHLI